MNEDEFELPIAGIPDDQASRMFWTWYRTRIQTRLDPNRLPPEGSAANAVAAAKEQLGEEDRAVVKFVDLYGKLKAGRLWGWGG
jgi:hypothetical protein